MWRFTEKSLTLSKERNNEDAEKRARKQAYNETVKAFTEANEGDDISLVTALLYILAVKDEWKNYT